MERRILHAIEDILDPWTGCELRGVLDQCVSFCKAFDAQRQLYADNAAERIPETLRFCRDSNWLQDYLKKNGAERGETNHANYRIDHA